MLLYYFCICSKMAWTGLNSRTLRMTSLLWTVVLLLLLPASQQKVPIGELSWWTFNVQQVQQLRIFVVGICFTQVVADVAAESLGSPSSVSSVSSVSSRVSSRVPWRLRPQLLQEGTDTFEPEATARRSWSSSEKVDQIEWKIPEAEAKMSRSYPMFINAC